MNPILLRAAMAAAVLAFAGCDDHPSQSAQAPAAPAAPAPVQSPVPAAAPVPEPLPAVAEAEVSPIATAARWGARGKADIDPARLLDENYYVILDGSGSMQSQDCSSGRYREGRIGDAREAVVAFERSLPASANLGLLVFDRAGFGERVALGHGPANRTAFEGAVAQVRAGGLTPLGPALSKGFEALAAQAERQGGYGTYHEVVETDGLPDSMPALVTALDVVTASPVVVETIGFCMDGDTRHPLNRPGRTIYYSARNPADVQADLKSIVAETDQFTSDAAGPVPVR